jgi:hypothetical protein
MKIDLVIALLALIVPYVLPPEYFHGMVQKWMLRPLFSLHAQSRLKKLERLQAHKTFLIELNASTEKQTIYLMHSALIVMVCIAGFVAFGVNIYTSFPRFFAGYVGVAAFVIYFLGLYKLGTHRRAYVPTAFHRTVEQIDVQIASLQTRGSPSLPS